MKKLVSLIAEKKVEPVASPHIHIMLPSIDPEMGLDALRHGLDTWEKHTEVRPAIGWNPGNSRPGV